MKKIVHATIPALLLLALTACGEPTSNTNLNNTLTNTNTNIAAMVENVNIAADTNLNVNDVTSVNTVQNASGIQSVSVGPNSKITSPFTITGKARGWYFEGSFPIQIVDANGKELYAGAVSSVGDWMKDDFVPFKQTITFATPTTSTGKIILKKDNPSGLSENDATYEIPVKF